MPTKTSSRAKANPKRRKATKPTRTARAKKMRYRVRNPAVACPACGGIISGDSGPGNYTCSGCDTEIEVTH